MEYRLIKNLKKIFPQGRLDQKFHLFSFEISAKQTPIFLFKVVKPNYLLSFLIPHSFSKDRRNTVFNYCYFVENQDSTVLFTSISFNICYFILKSGSSGVNPIVNTYLRTEVNSLTCGVSRWIEFLKKKKRKKKRISSFRKLPSRRGS